MHLPWFGEVVAHFGDKKWFGCAQHLRGVWHGHVEAGEEKLRRRIARLVVWEVRVFQSCAAVEKFAVARLRASEVVETEDAMRTEWPELEQREVRRRKKDSRCNERDLRDLYSV